MAEQQTLFSAPGDGGDSDDSLTLAHFAQQASLPWLERYNPIPSSARPARRTESDLQAAADHILAHGPAGAAPRGRVFSRLEWGEYLSWSAGPSCAVFMDGRIEIYPDDVWAQYAAVTAARADWEQILADRGVDWLLLDSAYHADLLPEVRRSPRWRQVVRSGPAVLFTRTPGHAAPGASPPPQTPPLIQSGK